jgi:hypothetical protein
MQKIFLFLKITAIFDQFINIMTVITKGGGIRPSETLATLLP